MTQKKLWPIFEILSHNFFKINGRKRIHIVKIKELILSTSRMCREKSERQLVMLASVDGGGADEIFGKNLVLLFDRLANAFATKFNPANVFLNYLCCLLSHRKG